MLRPKTMNHTTNSPEGSTSTPKPKSHRDKFLDELLRHLESASHKRLVEAYRKGDSVKSVEDEFGRMLNEIAKHEDKED
jgi:hypothetical protein